MKIDLQIEKLENQLIKNPNDSVLLKELSKLKIVKKSMSSFGSSFGNEVQDEKPDHIVPTDKMVEGCIETIHPLQNDKGVESATLDAKEPFSIDAFEELAAKYEYDADMSRAEAEHQAYLNFIESKDAPAQISKVAEARAKEVERLKSLRKPEVIQFWKKMIGEGEVKEAELIEKLKKAAPSRFPTVQAALNAIFSNEWEQYIEQVEIEKYKSHIWKVVA